MNNQDAPDFRFQPSSSLLHHQQEFYADFKSAIIPESYRQKPRKKRSKMMKIDNQIVPSSSTGSSVLNLKPKYNKKPNPAAPKITPPCTECGKKFWSWKALFGHMRCHPDRQWRGINPPPNFRRPLSPLAAVRPSSSGYGGGLEVVMTEDDHEIATCLLMLANGATAFEAAAAVAQCGTSNQSLVESGDFARDLDLLLLEGVEDGPSSGTPTSTSAGGGGGGGGGGSGAANCRFECSSCKKVFGSHQALGGHRASHKNVKGCFAITRNDGDYDEEDHHRHRHNNGSHGGEEERDGEVVLKENSLDDEKMMMVLGHRCSICLRVFSSGQALGGHKRCHWEKGEEDPQQGHHTLNCFASAAAQPPRNHQGCGLDLNLPAPLEDDTSSSYSSSGLTLDLRLGI